MSDRYVSAADLQAVFQFFGAQALTYFRENRTIPPACALVWLAPDAAAIGKLNQFPTEEIVKLMQDDTGRQKLAYAINAMFDPEHTNANLLPGERQHLVVQVMLANTDVGGVQQEVVLMLAHAWGVTHVTAVVVDPLTGAAELPKMFDITTTVVAEDPAPEKAVEAAAVEK
jgi:hypothetical protein